MGTLQRATVLALTLAGLACSEHLRTIEKYEKDGIQFSHFSDWRVAEDSPIEGSPNARSIILEGPNEALITFICLPPSSHQTLDRFAASVADHRAKAIEEKLSVGPIKAAGVSEGASEATGGRVGGQERNGIQQRFSVNFLGQEVPHEARFFAVGSGRYKVMVMTQVATQNAMEAKAAFDLTLDSLLIREPD